MISRRRLLGCGVVGSLCKLVGIRDEKNEDEENEKRKRFPVDFAFTSRWDQQGNPRPLHWHVGKKYRYGSKIHPDEKWPDPTLYESIECVIGNVQIVGVIRNFHLNCDVDSGRVVGWDAEMEMEGV